MSAEVITPKTLAGLRIQQVQQRSQYLNILLYAESGTGKTVLAGSADLVPEMSPVLVVDIEGGTESLRDFYPSVETVRVRTWKEMQAVYDVLHSGRHEYKTVVLDSLTEIQKFNMYQIMADLIANNEERDPDVPSMREWGKNIEQMRRFVRAFRDLEMHSIFTALDRVEKDQRTGAMNHLPMLSGKLASEVAAFLDIVAYYYTKQVSVGDESELKRLLLTKKTESIVAKDRTNRLPMIVEAPTMADLFALINPTSSDIDPSVLTEVAAVKS